jgi:hypothetical protein
VKPSIVDVKVGAFEALAPTFVAASRTSRQVRPRLPRSPALKGKVLAVIDSDSPGDAESYFARRLIERLTERCGFAEAIWVKKANRTHPPQAELWAQVVAKADVGVAMYGGCGTCSSRTMRDAIEMELAGIPAVAIAHEDLLGAIESMRTISRAVHTPYVLVSRPVTPNGDWGRSATEEVVERILPLVLGALTDDSSVAIPA